MSKVAIKNIDEEKCTGCFSCYNTCKLNSIEMKMSKEGFFVPVIDDSKCTDCGACYKKCPVIEGSDVENNLISSYAAWNTNKTIRKNSSSGGIFSAIADYIINDLNGIVYGATYENGIVKHIRAEDEKGLEKLRKSKYLPSFVGESYNQVINDLKNDKYVFFVGTPCQVDAINKQVINKEKLIVCDLVCHGVPSYLAFDYYLKSNNMNREDIKVDFRNKSEGWKNYKIIIKDIKNNKEISSHHIENKFFKGFVDNIYLKKACYDCKFSKLPRCGDITLGDFWGVRQENYSELGVSIVLANNEKGMNIIKVLKENHKIEIKEVKKDELGENKRIYSGVYKIPKSRKNMVSDLEKYDFDKFYKKYIYTSYFKRGINKVKKIIAKN